MKKCVISSYYSGDVYYDSSMPNHASFDAVISSLRILQVPAVIDFVDVEPKNMPNE